ncbi:hypothetical protein KY312_02220, partial [Candidatus Woesearchaeota archaeon]|nr:hypothetical protein [Candidatus Woesearchaeota archaeon]
MQKNHICFWGNPESDRNFYDKEIKNIFKKSFNIEIKPYDKTSNGVYGFYICNKKIIAFFKKILEFPIGKKTYSVKIPEAIFKNKKIVRFFIKGFFAGDGCLNFDKRYANDQKILKIIHTYPRIQIKCVSLKIITQMAEILDELNIKNFISKKVSKKNNEKDSYMLQISGKVMLEKWATEIGFANKNHSSKYEIFKKHGFVPPNTSFEERMKILKGELDPWSFYPKWSRSLVWIRRQKNE